MPEEIKEKEKETNIVETDSFTATTNVVNYQ